MTDSIYEAVLGKLGDSREWAESGLCHLAPIIHVDARVEEERHVIAHSPGLLSETTQM